MVFIEKRTEYNYGFPYIGLKIKIHKNITITRQNIQKKKLL